MIVSQYTVSQYINPVVIINPSDLGKYDFKIPHILDYMVEIGTMYIMEYDNYWENKIRWVLYLKH